MTLWHHSPPHHFEPDRVYFVSAGTIRKQHFFLPEGHRSYLQERLLSALEDCQWKVQAWAVLSNHYHFIAEATENAKPLGNMLRDLHSETARELNRLDNAIGREVWYQYWETPLTYQKSWLARLKYVNENAVHHGVALEATQYPHCSAVWFEREANPGFYRTVMMTKTDCINVKDDF